MRVQVSLVIGDVDDIRITASEDPSVIRQDLFEFYQDALEDEGLNENAPALPIDADIETICNAIQNWVGRSVVIEETEVISR